MATIWLKILVATIRDASIDVEVENLNRLKDHLIILRVSWEKTEVKAVAEDMEIYAHHGFVGIRRSMGEITTRDVQSLCLCHTCCQGGIQISKKYGWIAVI